MTVGTFAQTNFTTQDPATYKAGIDSNFMASARFVSAFAPHATTAPSMTVAVDAGFVFAGGGLTNTTAQVTSAFAASSLAGITRIDRIVGSLATGIVSVLTGTSVVAALTAGNFPIAQVSLSTATTAITNAMLTDERVVPSFARGADFQSFTADGTWNKPTGYSSNAMVTVRAWGAGGPGSSVTNGSGGGGGAAVTAQFALGLLTTAVAVTVGVGSSLGVAGGDSAFGAYVTAYGGSFGQGLIGGGGGGGSLSAGSSINGGNPLDTDFGGGSGGAAGASSAGADSAWGGGGGSHGSSLGATPQRGGNSIYGGGGGCGASTGAAGTAGVSLYGGNGGARGTAGSAPGGGGGGSTGGAPGAGGRGEVQVWVVP